MIKKIIVPVLILFMSFLAQGQITLTTTSNSAAWSPQVVTNTGATLTWTAASNGVFLGQVVNADDPTFDFSTNTTNDPIIITITNTGNDFSGLTSFDFWNNNAVGSEITDMDITAATALTTLNMRYNRLSTIDISQNVNLESLTIRGNRQLDGQSLNTTANINLTFIQIDVSGINHVDFSNNDLLTNVLIYDAKLPTEVLDQVVIDLDANNQLNGTLNVLGNVGQLSYNSSAAYTNLVGKGWTIDVPAPPSGPNTETITIETTSNQAVWTLGRFQNTGLILHWKAEGVGIATQDFDEQKPTFDFSANTNNDPITITVTSNDGFDYLTEMSLYIGDPIPPNLFDSNITAIDISNADSLKYVYPFKSDLKSIDVSQNVALQRLMIHGTIKQLVNQTNLDVSNNIDLYQLRVENTYIQTLSSLLNNPLLRDVDLRNSEFTSAALDQVLIDLDQNGISNPQAPQYDEHIQISGNPGSLTSASYTAYNNLITKGWTIDVPAPPAAPGPDINITGLGVSIPGNGTNTPSVTDDTDFGQVASGGTIIKTFTIENTGDQVLDLTGNPDLVAISGANAADFTISAMPTTPVAIGGNTTFEVTFNANSLGIRAAILTIDSNDPDEASYTFNIQAEATQAPGPEINVTGNGISIISGNTPIVADDTDFGQVAIGSPVTHTFTIENLGDSDLTINYFFTNTSNYFSFDPAGGGTIVLASGTSTTIDATFDPSGLGIQTGTITINSTDPDEGTYVVNLTADGIPASSGTIDVQGNSISIANGDTTPDVADDTDFGNVLNTTTKTTTYTIFNNHATENLTVDAINLGFGVNEFQMGTISETLPFSIVPGGSMTFDVEFTPTSSGSYSSSVEITNSESGQNPYQYSIAGQGADVVPSGDIMITQYYEGTGDNKWVEIKNISGVIIPASTYYLALYSDTDIPNIGVNAPTASIAIPELAVDEVLLFRNGGALLPTAGSIGPATQINATAVCSFTGGNDVILISSANDATAYTNRQDIIGTVPVDVWGGIFSFIRGGYNEVPEANFIKSNWIELSVGGDVDNADPNTNIALGTQDTGLSSWTGSWSNSINPDRTRNVEINTVYNASDGTFTAGNLIINDNLNLNGGTPNSVIVYGDLTINGSFIIGDQESLVMYDNNAIITGSITKLENSVFRNDQYDVTYWSSPIANANIGAVFSGVDPNRIFLYNQDNTDVTVPSDPAYYDVWEIASGPMIKAKGYAADGPTGTTGVHGISFNGVPNNGTISIELAKKWLGDGDADNDYNLIGNPYPSAIDSNIFLNGNGNIGGTIYLWTHTTALGVGGDYNPNDYATLNLNGGTSPGGGIVLPKIASSQGFMVSTINAGLVSFTNNMRIADANDQFYKGNVKKDIVKKDRIWLDIATNQGGRNQLLIGFVEKATKGIDHGYDSKGIWGANTVDFYSDIDGENYVIQGLPPFTGNETVDLGFDTKVAPRMMTISIHKMEGALKDADIYLIDHVLNKTHDLKASDYQFEQLETGSFSKRFTLQFAGAALDVDDDIFAKNEFIISNDLDGFNIRSAKEVKDIKVYDLLGRMIIQKQPNKKSFSIATTSIKNGTVLIVKATLENGSVVSKKTIKYE